LKPLAAYSASSLYGVGTISSMRQYFDVVIVGAGVAGCAVAIALQRLLPDLTILLLERNKGTAHEFRIGETLPPQTMTLLQQLGLSESFQARNEMAALGTCSVWGSEQVNDNPFLFSSYGHGWHIDRVSFDGWMVEQAKQANVTVINDATIVDTPQYRDGWCLNVHFAAESMIVEAPMVVDASGRSAAFSRSQGIRINTLDKLVGIFQFFQYENAGTGIGKDSFTLVESCESGWWYSARLPQGQWVATLMTDSDIARETGVLSETGWHEALARTEHTRKRFWCTRPLTSLQVKPAHSQCLERFCGTGWYAAGDAASVFDPLSSLGILKALRHGLLISYAIKDDFLNRSGVQQKYQHILDSEFAHYRQTRQQYYQLERRLIHAPFWQRRQTQMEAAIA